MRICIAAGVPLDSLEKFRFEDGSLDWRALLAAAQSQVDERIQQLRRLQTSITDYSGELVRKAFSPPKMGWCVPICCRLGWLHDLASTVMFAI